MESMYRNWVILIVLVARTLNPGSGAEKACIISQLFMESIYRNWDMLIVLALNPGWGVEKACTVSRASDGKYAPQLGYTHADRQDTESGAGRRKSLLGILTF